MAVDFDALVLGPCMDIFASEATLLPYESDPAAAGKKVRGVFRLAGADIVGDDGEMLRADNYTFGVRASEIPHPPVARGDHLTDILLPSGFLDRRKFEVDDTGDDGLGHQTWVLKEVIDDPDGY